MNTEEFLKNLELELHTPECRHNIQRIDELVADDFFECRKTGKMFGKKECLEWLLTEKAKKITTKDISVHMLTPDIGQVRYISQIGGNGEELTTSFRTSLWRKTESGWQMFFHQGTLVQKNTKFWKTPPIIKIYEALGAIADKRIEVSGNTAKVYSSSRGKYYDVSYDTESHSLMCNDNASYYNETLGYPAIAFLIEIGLFEKNLALVESLKNIPWKDINQANNNDYEKTNEYIYTLLEANSISRYNLISYASGTLGKIIENPFGILGEKVKPPDGY